MSDEPVYAERIGEGEYSYKGHFYSEKRREDGQVDVFVDGQFLATAPHMKNGRQLAQKNIDGL